MDILKVLKTIVPIIKKYIVERTEAGSFDMSNDADAVNQFRSLFRIPHSNRMVEQYSLQAEIEKELGSISEITNDYHIVLKEGYFSDEENILGEKIFHWIFEIHHKDKIASIRFLYFPALPKKSRLRRMPSQVAAPNMYGYISSIYTIIRRIRKCNKININNATEYNPSLDRIIFFSKKAKDEDLLLPVLIYLCQGITVDDYDKKHIFKWFHHDYMLKYHPFFYRFHFIKKQSEQQNIAYNIWDRLCNNYIEPTTVSSLKNLIRYYIKRALKEGTSSSPNEIPSGDNIEKFGQYDKRDQKKGRNYPIIINDTTKKKFDTVKIPSPYTIEALSSSSSIRRNYTTIYRFIKKMNIPASKKDGLTNVSKAGFDKINNYFAIKNMKNKYAKMLSQEENTNVESIKRDVSRFLKGKKYKTSKDLSKLLTLYRNKRRKKCSIR